MQGSRWHESKLLVSNKNHDFELEMLSVIPSRMAGLIDEAGDSEAKGGFRRQACRRTLERR